MLFLLHLNAKQRKPYLKIDCYLRKAVFMVLFDKEKWMLDLLSEFKEMDGFRATFQSDFRLRLSTIISEVHPNISWNEAKYELIDMFALQVLNVTESVIDKDKNYPQYRLEEELQKMNELVGDWFVKEGLALYEDSYKEVKMFMVNANKKVFDLSGTGFRLLEANVRIALRDFWAAFLYLV